MSTDYSFYSPKLNQSAGWMNSNNNFDAEETAIFLLYCMKRGEKHIEIISEHDDRYDETRVTPNSFNRNDKRLVEKALYLRDTKEIRPGYNTRLDIFIKNLDHVMISPAVLREIEIILMLDLRTGKE